jgi:hypothetical protein
VPDTVAKPVAPAVRTDALPDELKAFDQWVAWRFVYRFEKWTKVPISCRRGSWAKANDPQTWSTFASAVAYHQAHPSTTDGIGFVFSPDDPFAGIDLDDCRAATTGVIQPWARAILDKLSTYSEISASGTGIKAILLGKLPPGRRRKGQIELYDQKRFFALTGWRLDEYPGCRLDGCPGDVKDRRGVLVDLHAEIFPKPTRPPRPSRNGSHHGAPPEDEQLLVQATNADNGDLFYRLFYQGDVTGHGGDDSAADLALCNLLSFWTGPDPARIDQLFRRSALCRAKWTERADYRAATIGKALGGRTEFFNWNGKPKKPSPNDKADPTGDNGEPHEDAPQAPPGPEDQEPGEDQAGAPDDPSESRPVGRFRNYFEIEVGQADKKKTVRLGFSASALCQDLLARTDGWPKRIDENLFAATGDYRPIWLKSADALMAWLSGRLNQQETHKIHWVKGDGVLTQSQLFAAVRQQVERFDTLEPIPHYPLLPGAYYLHPPLGGADGSALRGLLARFNPSPRSQGVDADLLLAYFLTLLWGGPPGARPAFLFTAEEGDPQGGRGVGKTKLPQMAGYLVGGIVNAGPSEPIDVINTRLLSPAARDKRLILIDNIKSHHYSRDQYEAAITSDVISGRELFVGEGRRPNYLTWCLTINGASLSRDLAQRCVLTELARPQHDPRWETDVRAYIDLNHWAIIGDLLAILQEPAPTLERHSRWALWESQVLAHVADPGACQKVILERQGAVDDDAGEAEVVRAQFVEELTQRGHRHAEEILFVPSAVTAAVVNTALAEKYAVNRANAVLATLVIPELRRSKHDGARGWAWTGARADPLHVQMKPINARPWEKAV